MLNLMPDQQELFVWVWTPFEEKVGKNSHGMSPNLLVVTYVQSRNSSKNRCEF